MDDYPVVLVISRAPTAATPFPLVIEDDRVLNNAAEVLARLQVYQGWDAAFRTSGLYRHDVVRLSEVEATKARRLAELTPAPPLDWPAAVDQAAELARQYYQDKGDGASLDRLPRAVEIAKAQQWQKMGDAGDTWAVASQNGGGTYLTNGHCTCPDWQKHGAGWWCKHRIARALARRAAELQAATA